MREVNKAKDLLRINRDKMSFEMKSRFVKHIKRKLNIIQMIEDELKIDAQDNTFLNERERLSPDPN